MSKLIDRARKYLIAQPKSLSVMTAETGLSYQWLSELTKKRSIGRDFLVSKIEALLDHASANGWTFDEHNNPVGPPKIDDLRPTG